MKNYKKALQKLIKYQQFKDDDLKGIEFLRQAVRWMDSRNEELNARKTPVQLINEFSNSILKD